MINRLIDLKHQHLADAFFNDFSRFQSPKRLKQKKPRVLRVEEIALALKLLSIILDKGYQPLSNRKEFF